MDRFTQLEERLVKALQDLRESTDDRFSSMQTEIQNLKGELQKDISEQMNEKYTKLEGSVADTHAEFMAAKEDIKQQMKDLNKVQDKTKEMVHLVHEARNKYMLATQESMQQAQQLETTIQTHKTQMKEWESQMLQHAKILDQVGNVRQLLQSVEAHQTDMKQKRS